MRLPENLARRRFSDWNYLVRGIVEVWEFAKLLGVQEHLEQQLAMDDEGHLAELLGKLGNDSLSLAHVTRLRCYALSYHENGRASQAPRIWSADLMDLVDNETAYAAD